MSRIHCLLHEDEALCKMDCIVMQEAITCCVAEPWCDANSHANSGKVGVKLTEVDQAELRDCR